MRPSSEGFGGEFEMGKIAFEWKDFKKGNEEKKKGNRRILIFWKQI